MQNAPLPLLLKGGGEYIYGQVIILYIYNYRDNAALYTSKFLYVNFSTIVIIMHTQLRASK